MIEGEIRFGELGWAVVKVAKFERYYDRSKAICELWGTANFGTFPDKRKVVYQREDELDKEFIMRVIQFLEHFR